MLQETYAAKRNHLSQVSAFENRKHCKPPLRGLINEELEKTGSNLVDHFRSRSKIVFARPCTSLDGFETEKSSTRKESEKLHPKELETELQSQDFCRIIKLYDEHLKAVICDAPDQPRNDVKYHLVNHQFCYSNFMKWFPQFIEKIKNWINLSQQQNFTAENSQVQCNKRHFRCG